MSTTDNRKVPDKPNPRRNTSLMPNTLTDANLIKASMEDVPAESGESLKKWTEELYSYRPTESEFREMINNFSYKGFNRDDILKQLHAISGTLRTATELVILGALRGPQAASRILLSNGKTPIQMGIPASGGQGTKTLTMNKIQAATADLAAFYLKQMNVPKRIQNETPGWLQFPSAGSIKMPNDMRRNHIEFARKFSEIIGGSFQEQIYSQMEANSYLDPRLRLFD